MGKDGRRGWFLSSSANSSDEDDSSERVIGLCGVSIGGNALAFDSLIHRKGRMAEGDKIAVKPSQTTGRSQQIYVHPAPRTPHCIASHQRRVSLQRKAGKTGKDTPAIKCHFLLHSLPCAGIWGLSLNPHHHHHYHHIHVHGQRTHDWQLVHMQASYTTN